MTNHPNRSRRTGEDRYTVVAPATPGARPTVVGKAGTLKAARAIAVESWRADLVAHDVRIELGDTGQLVEYYGPTR